MNLLVTGGCGFIGGNFIRQRLLESNGITAKLVNLDALTCAGNQASLRDAVLALTALGYKTSDAATRRATLALGSKATTEQLIKKALG